MSQPTPGQWTVRRGTRTDSDGKKYGLEVAAHVPADLQRPWESAGYVPVADIFHPSNPIRLEDYDNPATKAEILATSEANARLIAQAPAMRDVLALMLDCRKHDKPGCVCGVEKARALLAAIDGGRPDHETFHV